MRASSDRATIPARWVARARGWIRVMHVDILCSLVIYTIATVAFYLLGAGVLNSMGVIPAAADTISGPVADLHADARRLGVVALLSWGVVTLYGTIFAATAAHSRVFADVVRIVGGYRA